MSVVSIAKKTIKSFLLKNNLSLDAAVSQSQLREFINSVKPIRTNHELIRVGGTSDGGYLIPNDIEGIKSCFSPGVSTIVNFEIELANRGIHCYMADYSVDGPPIKHENFVFDKKFLGICEDNTYTTLEGWMKKCAPEDGDYILQMDIEGNEYGVILDTSHETLSKYRILVIEFHQLNVLTNRLGFELINFSFQKLLRHFEVVHIHPNNLLKPVRCGEFDIPPLMEFTFLRKDRILSKNPAKRFPHSLDAKNLNYRDDVPLPECWYR